MAPLESLRRLSRIALLPKLGAGGVDEALSIVHDELSATDVYLVYGKTEDEFGYFGTSELGLSRNALWFTNRDLTTHDGPRTSNVRLGRVVGFHGISGRAHCDCVAALVPAGRTTANMLLAQGAWPDGLTSEQETFLLAALPSLGLLLERRLQRAYAEEDHHQLSTLVSVGRVISETEDLEAMLTNVAQMAAQLTAIDYVTIDVVRANGELQCRCVNYEQPANDAGRDRWKESARRPDPIRNIVIGTRQPLLFVDAQADERLPERARQFFIRTLIRSTAVLPLLTHDDVLGVLSVGSLRPMSFDQHERELLEGLAGQIAIAVKGVQLYEERRVAEAALRRSQDLLASTIESTADGILVVDAEGRVAHANTRFADLWRIPRSLLEERDDDSLIAFVTEQLADPEAFLAKVRALYDSHAEDLDTLNFKDGRVFERYSRALVGSEGIAGRVWSFRDITERKRADAALEASEHLYRQIFDGHSAVQLLLDLEAGVVVEPNAAACEFYGYARDRLVGMEISAIDVRTPDVNGGNTVVSVDDRPGVFSRRTALASGEIRDVDVFLGAVDVQGERLMHVIVQDVTERKQAERALIDHQRLLEEKSALLEVALESEREHARRDPLTRALNHGAIADMLRDALADTSTHSLAMVMVDVDDLKAANDTYGHQMGDAVLVSVAEALRREGAVVGRYGGDEFVALLPGASRDGAERYRAAVIAALADATLADAETGARVAVVASIGIAMYPEEANAIEDLIKASDDAMFAVKRRRAATAGTGSTARAFGGDRAAKMVGEIVPFLTSPGDLDEKLRLVAQRLTTGAGYAGVSFALFNEGDDDSSDLSSFAEAPRELVERWDETDEKKLAEEQPLRPILDRTQRPVLIADVATTPFINEARRALLLAADIHSAIVAPMVWQGKVVGTLSAGGREVGAFGPRDAQFLNAVATQVTAIVRTASLVDELQSASNRLLQAHTETVLMLASAAEAHDHSTGRHLHRVRSIAEALARELGYEEELTKEIGLAAVLHDIGKIRVPDYVLTSADSLGDAEWTLMKHHTTWGSEFLGERSGFALAAAVARCHHERWDGTGYPACLIGDEIPEAAAITAVADSLDAMTNDRAYRPGRPLADAIVEVQAWSGRQFSPRVVDALMSLYERGALPGMEEADANAPSRSDELAA